MFLRLFAEARLPGDLQGDRHRFGSLPLQRLYYDDGIPMDGCAGNNPAWRPLRKSHG